MGKKIKVNFFFDGKSRGPLLARASLKFMVVTYKAFRKKKGIIPIYFISYLVFIH